MLFCNSVPIAQATCFKKNLVDSTHNAIWKAIKELTQLRKTLEINFDFCVMAINDRALRVSFS